MKKRRPVVIAISLATIACMLAGCAKNGGSANTTTNTNDSEKTAITIMQSKTEANDGYKKAIAAYEKMHPGVTITLTAISGNDFSASLKAQMQSNPPTIFSCGSFQDLKDYGNMMADLSDMSILKHADKGTTDMFTKDGKVYAVPLYMEGYGFVINRQIFTDAGVSFDSMLTFDGMKKGFDTLKAKSSSGAMKAKYPNLQAVMEYSTKELWIAGDHDANVALTHDFSTATQAYNAKTLPGTGFAGYKTMVDFQAGFTANANDTAKLNSIDYTSEVENGLATERVAAIKQGDWVAPAVEAVDPNVLNKLDMLPYSVPGYSDGKYFTGVSGYWAINSKASEKQIKAAKDFIDWLYEDKEGQKIVVQDCKFIPPYDNFEGIKASDPLSQRLMDAISKGNTLNGFVYSGAPSTWSQQVVGVEVQKYLAGKETWDNVTKNSIAQWAELRQQQQGQ